MTVTTLTGKSERAPFPGYGRNPGASGGQVDVGMASPSPLTPSRKSSAPFYSFTAANPRRRPLQDPPISDPLQTKKVRKVPPGLPSSIALCLRMIISQDPCLCHWLRHSEGGVEEVPRGRCTWSQRYFARGSCEEPAAYLYNMNAAADALKAFACGDKPELGWVCFMRAVEFKKDVGFNSCGRQSHSLKEVAVSNVH
ncbi:Transcription factor 12 [Dissostichus eleginoides]|uniref:Transcription factor 12 n=1 Tax=Dissostichus eleginoides TaxID=100907 RepID=A0AAD9F7J6_DISEL|nr:Transcription factor 12 [Dissostichus eleginoides]